MTGRLHAPLMALCLLLAAVSETEAFGVKIPQTVRSLTFSSSELNLLPEQGNQLAAWEAAHSEDLIDQHEQMHTKQKSSAARELVARAFSLPSSMIRRKIPKEEQLFVWPEHAEEHDVVYYPIVGFQYVNDGPNHCRALPTLHSAGNEATCRLPAVNEALVGYFSPRSACKLQHCDDANSDTYCAPP